MNQKEPIPENVYRAAFRVYLYREKSEPEDIELVINWANVRYGNINPDKYYKYSFWALSLVANYGVTECYM